MKSYTEKEINNALDELQKRTAGLEGHELRAALTQFINEQPVYSEGKITVLWSGVRNEAEYIAKHASEFKDISKRSLRRVCRPATHAVFPKKAA